MVSGAASSVPATVTAGPSTSAPPCAPARLATCAAVCSPAVVARCGAAVLSADSSSFAGALGFGGVGVLQLQRQTGFTGNPFAAHAARQTARLALHAASLFVLLTPLYSNVTSSQFLDVMKLKTHFEKQRAASPQLTAKPNGSTNRSGFARINCKRFAPSA